ncbi:unnamed protein product [Linum trigynum]|uniref:RNase H type-1 domain-containing protein n=1 Tax=Linum trigynum TaxID=586398 RepID=A0AAV2ECN8_9ROSI
MLGEFLVALWYIWDQRNCHLWNKKKLEEWEILPRASNWLKDYLEKQSSPRLMARNEVQGWKPPQSAPVKINVDAACISDRGTGWGAVIRDGEGRFLFAGVRRSRTQWNPEEAEAMAIGFGLDLARRFGILEMEMESDCQGIIQQLQREEDRETESGLICAELRAVAQTLNHVQWNFVGRKFNGPAHLMAHVECDWESEEIWVDNPPQFLVTLLREDMGGNSNFAF